MHCAPTCDATVYGGAALKQLALLGCSGAGGCAELRGVMGGAGGCAHWVQTRTCTTAHMHACMHDQAKVQCNALSPMHAKYGACRRDGRVSLSQGLHCIIRERAQPCKHVMPLSGRSPPRLQARWRQARPPRRRAAAGGRRRAPWRLPGPRAGAQQACWADPHGAPSVESCWVAWPCTAWCVRDGAASHGNGNGAYTQARA